MRIKISLLAADGKIKIPLQYNHLLQGFIYSYLSKPIADKIHNEGFKHGKRAFRLFVFSRIFFKTAQIEQSSIIIDGPFHFFVASPIDDFLISHAQELMKRPIKLMNQRCELISLAVCMPPTLKPAMVVNAISPITCYSTLLTKEGKRKTCYYSPFEREFSQQIYLNLKKKYYLIYGKPAPEEKSQFKMEPLFVDKSNEKILIFKGTVIKGWLERYKLSGSHPPELFKVGYDSGFGSKNSQGFGMVEVVRGE